MRRLIPFVLPVLAACSAAPPMREAGGSDAACIHRIYDYPTRSAPFPAAVGECAGNRTVDLTGDRYFQALASSFNIPFVSRDPRTSDSIILTGSRFPQPTDLPPPPELSLR